LKIPKRLSEAVNQRWSDNTMAKRERTKKTNIGGQNTTQKNTD